MSPEVCALHPDGCQAIRMTDDEVEALIERGAGDMVTKPQTGFPGISYGREPSQAAADAYIAAAEALDAARLREADAFLHAKARIKGCTDGQAARMATVAASGELEVLEARLNIARVQFLLQRG